MMFRYGKVQAILVKRYVFFRKYNTCPSYFFFHHAVRCDLYTEARALLLLLFLQTAVFIFYFGETLETPV